MIDLGCNISGKILKKKFYPSISNNDLIGFAIDHGKLETVKVLINNGAPLCKILVDSSPNKYLIHTSIIIAITSKKSEIFEYLLSIDEINSTLTNDVKKYLLDYAITNSFITDTIIKSLSNVIDTNMIDFNNKNIIINSYEKMIEKIAPFFKISDDYEKFIFIEELLNFYLIIKGSIEVNNSNIFNIIDKTENIYENIYDISYFYEIIMCDLTVYNKCVFKTCIEILSNNEIFTIKNIIKNLKLILIDFKEILPKINNSITIIEGILSKYKSIDKKITVTRKTKGAYGYVLDSLYKLYWPVKQDHYDYMYENLTNNQDTIIEESENKIILLTKYCVRSTIVAFKDSNCPSKWFKRYAPNIGSEDKDDYNHSFSFLLDSKLKNFACIEQVGHRDLKNIDRENTVIYFYGVIQYKDIIEIGCYEYFINSFGTLFHRMFRPINNIPKNIKDEIDKLTINN